ncbi:acyl-CoA dehydrogenase-like protein [Sphingomonas sp. MM-1]|uniref:acyl-CoA dehydrogenase family protein n=1 Tax=Sphingomonas sp. MM-1 TaxID=745310 RepID=UPI0002C117C6|nr:MULTISPECIES: acyl-CoA dehydrogenase family protein [unclassified Sphingomonas]AGH50994.1 acyl-CoA dehydrogenase-like protein [Sphingomonas sp. MM-1]MDX3885264.1 acyl-CoA dehydrogenase family protein [Sphingomonas sp.]
MALFLTEEQVMLKDMAGPFLADQAPVKHLRQLRDANDAAGFSRDLWRRFGEMGLAGVLVPEAQGGGGLGHVEAGIVLEEIGRNLSPSPFLSTAVAAVTAIGGADAELRARWLPGIAAGETVAAIAVDEGRRHDPANVALAAERSGNGFRLNGAKRFVVHGHVADLLIVAARTSSDVGEMRGITLFAVERGAAGLSADPVRMVDSSIAAEMLFEDVEVDAGAVIGTVDDGWSLLTRTLDAGRVGAAAEMLGVGGAAMAMTMDYLRQRKQFGRLIGEFQALQHRAAHLYSELEIARAATLKAAQLMDADDPKAELMAAVAKAKAGKAAMLAVQEGVQMHGGIGMTDEYDIGLYMKRHRLLDELFGDTAFHAERVARLNNY